MTSFSLMVQTVCLGVLGFLLFYTLWLMRSGHLNAHVTVRWVLAECGAIVAVLLWARLPFITYTSAMGDRELLVILAVIIFAFVAFLMLDCLSRISTHTYQIKRLTQELALLRETVQKNRGKLAVDHEIGTERGSACGSDKKGCSIWDVIIAMWMLACICLYLLEIWGPYPSFLTKFFTADYLQ